MELENAIKIYHESKSHSLPSFSKDLQVYGSSPESSRADDAGNIGLYLKSRSFGSEDNLLHHNRHLELQIRMIQGEVANMKRKLMLFEEETNRNRWAIRYSRRMAIMSNMLLGLWIFWSRFLSHVQKQKKSHLFSVVVPNPLSITSALSKSNRNQYSLNKILYEGYMKAISKSWVFFVGALLLTRHVSWKRHLGLGLTTAYSLYLAIFSRFLPWTNYFNMFANLLYITAGAFSTNPESSSTLDDFLNNPDLSSLLQSD